MAARLVDDDARIRLSAELRETIAGTADYVLATTDCARGDRLWPADAEIFLTNPLSVAYGACGTALFLANGAVPRELPEPAVDWILDRPLLVEEVPPGLYVGLSGIAWSLLELGLPERAEEAMALAYRSPLLYEAENMRLGAAGWGLASLRFFQATGSEEYLDRAKQAGDFLLDRAVRSGESCHWPPGEDEPVPYGFGFGASGIALFLAELYVATGDRGLRETALGALEFDLANRVETEIGWGWRRFEGDNLVRPYWMDGAAGVGSVAIRLHRLLGADHCLSVAEWIAAGLFVKFAVTPGQFEGLAGIGELMLDMHRFTAEDAYLDHAFDLAESILLFKVERERGVAWPGRWLNRITHDYASGAAGIGLFFARLQRPQPRLFLDP